MWQARHKVQELESLLGSRVPREEAQGLQFQNQQLIEAVEKLKAALEAAKAKVMAQSLSVCHNILCRLPPILNALPSGDAALPVAALQIVTTFAPSNLRHLHFIIAHNEI